MTNFINESHLLIWGKLQLRTYKITAQEPSIHTYTQTMVLYRKFDTIRGCLDASTCMHLGMFNSLESMHVPIVSARIWIQYPPPKKNYVHLIDVY